MNHSINNNKYYKKDKTQKEIKSLHSLDSKNVDQNIMIYGRLNFMKELLSGKKLDPIINIDINDTEYFIDPCKFNNRDSSEDSNDTRIVLNKRIHDFDNIIKQIGGTLYYIKSGTTGHTFRGIIKDHNGRRIEYAVKVVAYPKKDRYGDIYDVERPENAELKMIRLLSYFIVNKQSPHIVLPIGTFDTHIKHFVSLIDDGFVDKYTLNSLGEEKKTKYAEFVEKYKDDVYHDYVSILISEWVNGGDLLDYIRKNYREFTLRHWKVIFFQIISVLAVIQSKFPAFRHNDLKANNILVEKIDVNKNNRFKYTINGRKYVVPVVGIQIKIWDFDFACIPGIVDNMKVCDQWTNEINVKPVKNQYYDMHYFFNTLIKDGFFGKFMKESCIPQEAKDFINRIIPSMYRDIHSKYVSDRGRILIDDEYFTPDYVLRHDEFFKEFHYKNYLNKKRKQRNDPKVQNYPITKYYIH